MTPPRDLMGYFSQWAPIYDETVREPQGIFAEVFAGYENILKQVIAKIKDAGEAVVDVGAGTGNLALGCHLEGLSVVCVDPNAEMRAIAKQKLPSIIPVLDGSFLNIPLPCGSVDAATGCWSFHHLTDSEKPAAARELTRVVKDSGKIVMVDTAYENDQARVELFRRLSVEGKDDWIEELQAEYYTTLSVLEDAFRLAGRPLTFTRMNPWVWLWEG